MTTQKYKSAQRERQRQSVTAAALPRLCGYVASLLIAYAALHYRLELPERMVAGVPPAAAVDVVFGFERLLVVHLLLSLPLCAVIARQARSLLAPEGSRTAAIACCAFGALVTAAGLAAAPHMASTFDAAHAGLLARVVGRTAFCMLLELPWCVAGELFATRRTEKRAAAQDRGDRFGWIVASTALLAAIALPMAYARDLGRREADRATQLVERQQMVQAARLATALSVVGTSAPVADMPPREAAEKLTAAVNQLEQVLLQTDAGAVGSEQIIQRAAVMAMLDRLPEAQQLLLPLAAEDTDAALLLAAILQQRGAWDESTRWYRTVAERLQPLESSPRRTANMLRAINGVAFNARERGAYADAESAYEAGLAQFPEEAAHFHFQLGRHHKLGGRPVQAAEHLQAAAQLAPAKYARQVEALLGQMSLDSPGCMLRLPAGAAKQNMPSR